mmetsp:Transcript_65813/g.174492  ORF Transcript_65813/g.174492 Transcript_65813/m.174492 type:complete len:131 (-) Transcript_65813:116-508(-)|eukprot:CAMPEP_0194489794 /NCGR_PEP_ID=MMETSP0253-20130528/9218_1 /TAXON_ID=2966 /ORGANISM="Noctiluca scintillans" /LENGTH=130 /DNA_ID=CAMNT_0039330323 /DNA_START=51 /DNA_END=443 /DNA_ORIENTATION=+
MGVNLSRDECGVLPFDLCDCERSSLRHEAVIVVPLHSTETYVKQCDEETLSEDATQNGWQPMQVTSSEQEKVERERTSRMDARHVTPPQHIHAYVADDGAILADFQPRRGKEKLQMTFEYVASESVPVGE